MGGLTGCASSAEDAYKATAILGSSRQIVHYDYEQALRFTYRGGTVIYRPWSGSKWLSPGKTGGQLISSGISTRNLPNGCLVYACERAEQIRLRPREGETKSQVIAYIRADGGGHAFVVFRKGALLMAEDNLGFRGELPRFRNRSSAEALRLARSFRAASGRSGVPVQAWFLGEF